MGRIAKTSIATNRGIKVLGSNFKRFSISVIIILRQCICNNFMLKLEQEKGVTPFRIRDSALDELEFVKTGFSKSTKRLF